MKLITKSIAADLMAAYEHSAETGESGKDVVADGTCITQRAGFNGAKSYIDEVAA